MKKSPIAIIIVLILIIISFFVLKQGEQLEGEVISEDREKEEKQKTVTEEISFQEQQAVVIQARELYSQKKQEGMKFSSQCLGVVGFNVKFVVDIIHVPRTKEDDKQKNQCEDYIEGRVNHFIELDQEGNIFRIV